MKIEKLLFLTMLVILSFTSLKKLQSQQSPQVKIGFFGNSITMGLLLSNPYEDSYPAQLSDMLTKIYGDTVIVGNFAVTGRTMLKNGDSPLWDEKLFADGLDFAQTFVLYY